MRGISKDVLNEIEGKERVMKQRLLTPQHLR